MITPKFAVSLAVTALCAVAIPLASADPTPQHDAGSGSHKTSSYKAPLNGYGQPDLEGTWTNATLTVLERPAQYGERLVLTEDEAKKIESTEAKTVAEGNAPTDPKVKTTDLPYNCGRGFSGAGLDRDAGGWRAAQLVYYQHTQRARSAVQGGHERAQSICRHARALW